MTPAELERVDALIAAVREQTHWMERLHETLVEVTVHRRASAARKLARLARRVERASDLGDDWPPLQVVD